jgi:hypothetical protein
VARPDFHVALRSAIHDERIQRDRIEPGEVVIVPRWLTNITGVPRDGAQGREMAAEGLQGVPIALAATGETGREGRVRWTVPTPSMLRNRRVLRDDDPARTDALQRS